MSAHERQGRLTHRRWPRIAGGWWVTRTARRAISQLKSTLQRGSALPPAGPRYSCAAQARHGPPHQDRRTSRGRDSGPSITAGNASIS